MEPFLSRGPLESSRETSPRYAARLPRALEAPPIDDLRGQHQRPLQRGPAETLQTRDRRREGRRQRQLFDLAIELVPPLELVGEQGVIFAEHQPVGRREGRGLAS